MVFLRRAFAWWTKWLDYLSGFKVSIYATHAGYFMVLSLFPTLVLLLGLLRYTGLDVRTLTDMLSGFLPEALVLPAKQLIVSTYRSTSGTLVSVSALTALWSASRGVYGLLTGLNSIYGVAESRGYFYTRTVSVAYTFVFLLVLVLTLGVSVFGNAVLPWLPAAVAPLRFWVLLAVQTGLFATMFVVLPNRKCAFGRALPGALLASLGWQIFSGLYSVYVEHFSDLGNVFGNVYGVAVSMLWLYCCISILFYGGVLNHYLEHRKKPGTIS